MSNDCQKINRLKVSSSIASDDFPEEEEIVLAVYWKRGKLGAAFYNTCDAEVHLLSDVVDTHPHFQNLRCLLNQVQYTHIVTCSSLADCFIETLSQLNDNNWRRKITDSVHCPSKRQSRGSKLHFISGISKNTNYDACKRLILGYCLFFEPKFSTEEERLLFMETFIDFKKKSMVMSLGILFKFLEKYIPQKDLSSNSFRISIFQNINLDNVLSIDEATYDALEIFRTVDHPSAFKSSDQSAKREGLSVFGIFNRCKSKIGLKKMRHVFMNPLRDVDEINARLDAVEFCCKPAHGYIIKNLNQCIRKVESVTGLLRTIYRSRANVKHWKSLYSSLYNMILIGKISECHSSHSKIFFKIAKSVSTQVHEAAHFIGRVIDFEESLLTNEFSVKVGINKKLDRIRQAYSHIPGILLRVANLELRDLPECISECTLVYITELGYLLSVPAWQGDGTNAENYQLPNFEIKFLVNKYVHYKTPRCSELDKMFGDVLASKCRLESKIMIALMEFIHSRVSHIVRAVNSIAELDCIIAMAEVASENDYSRPEFTVERKLEILGGRHPLQELCVNNFVPNDAMFDAKNSTIKILTGPNASGKTVYLNQISLIAFLAHIGSFVPAEKAHLCVLDYIHTRAHNMESVSTRMSSFILDLKQISSALYNSTPSSLIIMDEFGKGSTEIDGLSLLTAILNHFVERMEGCPFVLVSTHFHSLLKLLPETPLISFQYMDYEAEGKNIVYLHRIKEGSCDSSFLHLAAKYAGLGENSLKRFLQIQSSERQALMCNTNLNITKIMVRAMRGMERALDCNKVDQLHGGLTHK